MDVIQGLLKNITLRTKLLISALINISMLLVVAVLGLHTLSTANSGVTRIVQDDYPSITLGNQLIREINITIQKQALLLSSIQSEQRLNIMNELQEASVAITGIYNKLGTLVSDDESKAYLGRLTEKRREYLHSRTEFIDLVKVDSVKAQDFYMTTLQSKQQEYTDEAQKFIDLQEQQMQGSYSAFVDAYQSTKVSMAVIFVAEIFISVSLAWVIIRSITTPLKNVITFLGRVADGDLSSGFYEKRKDELGQLITAIQLMQKKMSDIVSNIHTSAEQIAGGANEIMSGTNDLAARTEEQASSVEQTAASVEEFTATISNTRNNTHFAADLSTKTESAVSQNASMMANVSTKMAEIYDSANQMTDIINLIDSIAFQTNILALNAAVEAARAGEHGRGFAVVAQEVRALAQKTATSSHDIRNLIGESSTRIVAGRDMVIDANKLTAEMMTNVTSMKALLDQINQASTEQADGISQINVAISQIDITTQQNSSLVEQSLAASAMLSEQAENMVNSVRVFKLHPAA